MAPEVLLSDGRGLRKVETPVTLRLGVHQVRAMKIEWFISTKVRDVLAHPKTGIAWARGGFVANSDGVDPDRFDGDFTNRKRCGRHGGVEKVEIPELTKRACAALEDDEGTPNAPLGLTQWIIEDPSAEPFASLERAIREHAISGLEPLSGATKETYTALHGLADETIDMSRGKKDKVMRVKLFYPKYKYGNDGGAKHGMCMAAALLRDKCPGCHNAPVVTVAKCNAMPDYIKSFASNLLDATERAESPDGDATERAESPGGLICKLDSINSALVNLYLRQSGSTVLGRHYDSPHIFARPIYTLRLLRPATLSFVTGGLRLNVPYLTEDRPHVKKCAYPIYFDIPLPRGCLTEMSGFAANVLEHCVRLTADDGPTASLVLRHIHESLLGDAWVASNSVARKPGVPAEGTFPSTGAVTNNKRSRECSDSD